LRSYSLALLAEVAAQAGDVIEGLRLLGEVLVAVEKSGDNGRPSPYHGPRFRSPGREVACIVSLRSSLDETRP
jgi:hypothetical protein